MLSSERNLKIVSVTMVVIALFMLLMPWIKVTGVSSAERTKIKEYMDMALDEAGAYVGSPEELNYARSLLDAVGDLSLSPKDMFTICSQTRSLAKSTGESESMKDIMLYMLLYDILFLLTVASGIYAIVFAIRRKPLLMGFDGLVFPGMMALLAIINIYMVIKMNSGLDAYTSMVPLVGNYLGNSYGFRFTLWMILAVIFALPYFVWENVLGRAAIGQKALKQVDKASTKVGVMLDKGNEKIHNISTSWECPKCGTHVMGDAKFCPKCGTIRPVDQSQPAPGVKRPTQCPKCGKPVGRNDKFCQSCGFNIDEFLKQQPVPQPQVQQAVPQPQVSIPQPQVQQPAPQPQPQVQPAPQPQMNIPQPQAQPQPTVQRPPKPEVQQPAPQPQVQAAPAAPMLQEICISREEAKNGCAKVIDTPDGRSVRIKLPAGISSGKKIKLKGVIKPENGEPAGDMILRIIVRY